MIPSALSKAAVSLPYLVSSPARTGKRPNELVARKANQHKGAFRQTQAKCSVILLVQKTRRAFHTSREVCAKHDDLHAILGVSKNADKAEIKRAYYKLAKEHHPDKVGKSSSAERQFAKITKAYDILMDDEKTRIYEQYGMGAFDTPDGTEYHDPNKAQESIGFGAFKEESHLVLGRGANVDVDLTLTFEEALQGCTKKVDITAKTKCTTCGGTGSKSSSLRIHTCPKCKGSGVTTIGSPPFAMQRPCSSCEGTGKVVVDPCKECSSTGTVLASREVSIEIPAGVDNGVHIRVQNEGHAGMRGNPPGHLFYHIKVKSHRFWRREQADIHLDVPISLSQALLGDTIKVPTIRGGDLEIAIPPGVQPFETRMLKGKGAPVLGGSDKGNMYLHFITKFPRSLSDNQKKLIAQFAIEDKGNDEAVEDRRDWFIEDRRAKSKKPKKQ